jgi:K+-sensing histidine kinase KdpD
MLSAWFGGLGPGLLATALSLLAFKYYFAIPVYSLAVDIKEIPRVLLFALSTLFVGLMTAAQRRAPESLRRARDELAGTVKELKRINDALHATLCRGEISAPRPHRKTVRSAERDSAFPACARGPKISADT